MEKKVIFLFCLFVCSCAPSGYFYPSSYDMTDYKVKADKVTPRGVKVDTSGYEVDLEKIDAIIESLGACLGENIVSEWITVKIAPDWSVSPCTGKEYFPCDIPPSACKRPVSEQCPCSCAGTVQNGNIVVVTANLAALAHEVAHLVTGAGDPFPPEIAKCAN